MRCPRPVPGRNGDPSCQRLSGHSLSPSLLIVICGLDLTRRMSSVAGSAIGLLLCKQAAGVPTGQIN